MALPKSLITQTMRRWRQIGAARRMRIDSSSGGHFVVYSIDRSRFVIPLKFLRSRIVVELLKMAEDEFGFSSDQPIVLPFESCTMNQIIMHLIISSRQQAKEMEMNTSLRNYIDSLAQFN